MRLFLAINLPDSAKESLANQIYPLQKDYPIFNWVHSSNFHLTVHFFGETKKSEQIIEKTKNMVYDQEKFHLYATNLDYFMNHHITIYVNFRRERLLEKLIEKARETFGNEFQEVKSFIPHITVARCRIPSKQQYFHLQKKIQRMEIEIDFPVNEVTLFESIMTGHKPEYREIVRIPLAEKL